MGWTFYNASGEALTSFGPVALTDLDIDGGTAIGEAIVGADLFIADNGAGGTNVKVTGTEIANFIAGNVPAVAKAYGTIEGGTLQSNSLGITDGCLDSTGVYTVAWNFTWANANYAVMMTVQAGANRTCTIDEPTTTQVTAKTYIASSGALDSNNYHIVAFGDPS